MGTKIHTNQFLREFHSVIDLDSTASNAMRSSYNDNGKNPGSISCYDIEKVRQTILEHESVFKNQLRELHRLYGRQQELMNEIKGRRIVEDDVMSDKFRLNYLLSPFSTDKNAMRSWNSPSNSNFHGGTYNVGSQAELYSKFPIVDNTSEKRNHRISHHDTNVSAFGLCDRNSYRGDTSITVATKAGIPANSWSNLDLVTKDFFQNSLHRMNKDVNFLEKRSIDKHISLGDGCSGKSVAFPQSLLAEPRKEFPNSPLDIGTSLSWKKKKIFGVEISEGNDDAFGSTSNMSRNLVPPSSSFVQNLGLDEGNERSKENPKGTLPWFLRDSQGSSDLNKTRGSYFMNLDSLQSCSPKFFKKVEVQNSNQKKEVGGEIDEVKFDIDTPKNNLGTEGVVMKTESKSLISDLRHCIDLNLSLDEEEAPYAPPFPSAVVKIATTEIDLEAPAVIEPELNSNESSSLEEHDKFAAEVMIAISSHVEKKQDDDDGSDDSFARLKRFAELLSSEGLFDESVPSDMDDFEFMTLKLEDVKEEHPPYEPFLKAPTDDEASTRRNRRGQSRRGRQRRDFQRDILPGLVTLSRLQVTEDFQAFEELLKAGDGTRESGLGPRGTVRNGRGRKRLGAPITVKAPCSSHAEIEERSLAGWGKKTRRLPRQRCPNALLSFPVKC